MQKDAEDRWQASVLYVEDDTEIREQLTRIIKRKFVTVLEAQNGEEGLALYKEKKPDVVIADIMMPVMNGLEMSRAIKGINPHTPILLVTAYNSHEFIIEALELGIEQFVLKPVNVHKLYESIEKVMETLK